jgi:RNA 3'-terminal phosphate cyclase (ATP)
VLAWLKYQHLSELFSKPGQRGLKAEHVAKAVCRQVQDYENADAPVGPYLADQLLLPLAIAAHHGQPSQFRTVALTRHSTTHIDILQRFLQVSIEVEASEENNVLVRLARKD